MLEDNLARAQAIISQAGIDIDPCLVIRGDDLGERLTWLRHATERLERETGAVQAELQAWQADAELRAMEALVKMPPDEQRSSHAEMMERASAYAERADELEAEVAAILQSNALGSDHDVE